MKKKVGIASACLCAIAIVGCVSRESVLGNVESASQGLARKTQGVLDSNAAERQGNRQKAFAAKIERAIMSGGRTKGEEVFEILDVDSGRLRPNSVEFVKNNVGAFSEECLCRIIMKENGLRQVCSLHLAETAKQVKSIDCVLRYGRDGAGGGTTQATLDLAAKRMAAIGDDKAIINALCEWETLMLPSINDDLACRLIVSDKWSEVCNTGTKEDKIKKILERMSVKSKLKVAAEAKESWIGEMALEKLDPSTLANAVKDATPAMRKTILSSTRDSNVILAVLKLDPVMTNEKIAKKIVSKEIAEYLFEHGDFSGLKSRTEYIGGRGIEYSDSYQAAVIIKAIVQRLGDAKLNELAAEAKKRAEEKRSSAMVFGDFYLDMPTLDFFVLARVMRINPDWGYKTMTAEQDWKKRFVVSSFEFKAKDRASILDCEDSLVLQQVIHQCVKHKDGKATILDYVGEIDADAKVEKTWDGRSLEVGVWTEYVNTKLDVKIRYNKKEGTLDFAHR